MTDYIYFVNLDDFHVCHNLGFTSTLSCASIAHKETYKEEHPLYEINPDKILGQMNSIQTFISPRLSLVMQACWNRNGYKIGIGQSKIKFYSNEHVGRINRVAEIEIQFEKIRRKINTDLPSRLICLYLAPDCIDGRIMLQNMFFDKKSFYIVSVKISRWLRFHKADSDWISEYEKSKDITSIENYWKGISFSDNPQYEYLLDGTIELLNNDDKENILQHNIIKHIPDMKNDS